MEHGLFMSGMVSFFGFADDNPATDSLEFVVTNRSQDPDAILSPNSRVARNNPVTNPRE
jgi:hypothetical protein